MHKFLFKKDNKKISANIDWIWNFDKNDWLPEIIFLGPLGVIKQSINNRNSLLFIDKFYLNSFNKKIIENFKSITTGWFYELELRGLGYKSFYMNNMILLDIGYSNLIVINPTLLIDFKIFKNKIFLFSKERLLINNVISIFKKLTPIDKYRGKGIVLKKELIKLKKKSKH